MVRRAAKVDDNQRAIVAALRGIGCSVQSLAAVGKGCPDLLVGYMGMNLCLEVKDGNKPPSKRKLTDYQEEWHAGWRGDAAVVENVEQAIEAVTKRHRNHVDFVPFLDALRVIGNGDFRAGAALIQQIAERLEHARSKHPVFAQSPFIGGDVVFDEGAELVHAVMHEGMDRAHYEALDVLATAVRFCNREWEISPDPQAVTSPPCDK